MNKITIMAAALMSCAVAHAQYTSIDLSPYTDYQSGEQTQGYNYPGPNYSYSINGVPFTSSYFGGYSQEGLIYLGPSTGVYSADIAVDETGIQSIYTEINSAYGATGTQPGTVTLVGSAASVTYDLVEGENIRDHYYGEFTNTVAPGIGGTVYWSNGTPIPVTPGDADPQYYGYVRNDIQGWVVPTYIGELDSVDIAYTNVDFSYGEPLVYGLTTSTNPLAIQSGSTTPGPTALLPYAVGGLGVFVRRRRR